MRDLQRSTKPASDARREERAPSYRYQSEQASLLLPFYLRYVWNPVLPLIPAWISPNALTIAGTASAAAACVLAVSAPALGRAWLALSAALVLLYLTLDNLDGFHARRTGRSSRLGEFLDHWLDTFNSAFVTLAVCLALAVPGWVTLGVLVSANVAFFGVHWAHRQTGAMRMGKLADIEGGTVAALILLAAALSDARRWTGLAVALALAMFVQSAWTAAAFVLRVPTARREWLPLCAGTIALGIWIGVNRTVFWPALVMLALLNPLCTGRTIAARVAAASSARLDIAGVFLVCAGALHALLSVTHPAFGPIVAWGGVSALALFALVDLVHAFRTLRSTS